MAEIESDRNKAIAALLAELRRQGIRDDRVLAAIGDVPRERFVPTASGDQAWANAALPIGAGQTISQPYIVALMTAALRLSGDERVLEIGTGSGYQAAILAALAAEVVTVERHASLAVAAESLLRDLGYANVRVVVGDGTIGWPECAPYDRIIVTAGAPRVPAPLIAELSQDGGRLVIPVGEPDNQVLLVVERHGDRTTEQPLGPVRFVPLIGRAGWEVPVR
ncbi:MAG: protein-L-isoaspartate(D-aspartate) O-methyltransferase [Thermomicrobiales bacterium]|jgi:protein-L-isoaspartate(D-aspartate) O-methyltransferase|nr:protein-L-isoaspartate(D-aspartate) O-methyltransferase [Thermomicrobiales bacterium]